MTLSRRAAALALCALLALPGAALAKAKKVKKKAKDPDAGSRYKFFHALDDHQSPTYRFDAYGNPIPPPESRKKLKKKKKVRSDQADAAANCDTGDACSQAGDGAAQP